MLKIDFSLLIQMINVLVLLLLLNIFLFRPILKIMNQRRELTEGSRARAAKGSQQAEENLNQYQGRVREVRQRMLIQRQEELGQTKDQLQATLAEEAGRQEGRFRSFKSALEQEIERIGPEVAAEARAMSGVMVERLLGESP